MSKTLHLYAILIGLVALVGCGATQPELEAPETGAQLFPDLGPHRRPITTNSSEAQAYFDQGLTWLYSFNHDEAIRAFTRAADLDPDCAMAWWGVSLGEGPNYNDPEMTEKRSTAAWEALQKARERIDKTTPVERALIEALTHRYANPWPEDRSQLEQAYADAMAEVWATYPEDTDVATLYAEALMVRTPWKLYTEDGEPKADTWLIVDTLERAMELDPNNPGAKHLYIHAVEPSKDPDRGLVAADTLSELVPNAGHLLHMPSHIYVKTGRWEQAITQNQKAVRADAAYRERSPDQGIQYLYMVHNAHMLAYAAMMSGREQQALEAANAMWETVPEEALEEVGPLFDKWMCSVYDVQKRFGRWNDILEADPPPAFLPITTATWRAHRAVAYAAKKDFDNARRELEEFRKVKDALPEDTKWGRDSALKVLMVSDFFIQGEIALQQGDLELAAQLLEQGAEVEDTLGYGEPPQWLQPVRHTLGAVYLTSGKYEQAERAYREDLAKWRGNGWSLYGLSRALEEQGKTAEAGEARKQHELAWADADEPTKTSCKCIPST
jgi:tetratricopeptide (TPR) repeat protein